jgi:putative ABC transport system substrate-binding protein
MTLQRREFITLLGGAAAWPLGARAQQPDRMRRVAMLVITGTSYGRAAFREEFARLGWIEGRNLRFDEIVATIADRGIYLTELMNLDPEVIIALGGGNTLAVREKTQTIPIVSMGAGDVFGRIVKNIARPEGNITGVSSLFSSFGGKWLELLKEAVPQLEKVAYIKAPPSVATDFFPSIVEAAKVLAVQATEISYRNSVDIVHGIDAFAAAPNAGLIVTPASFGPNLETILTLAAQHRLPMIVGSLPREGALICYGPNTGDLIRRGAFIVDRILRGAKPSELPVEFPTKFELTINLKTARALGLEIPTSILLRADDVIE